ncbi:MAG: hypothetical protein V1678_01320 [Candidatus Aenigmatarchaeota archaeon]
MEKEELVKFLMNASEIEEQHSSAIAKFFVDDFGWEGVDEEKVSRVKEILKTIGNQTVGHERMINDLIGMLGEAEADEF